jgi:hypothetical protein
VLSVALLLGAMTHGPLPNRLEIHAQSEKCGFVFYVDGPRAGDGIFISKDGRSLFLERRPGVSAERACLSKWATKRGLKVRYIAMRH